MAFRYRAGLFSIAGPVTTHAMRTDDLWLQFQSPRTNSRDNDCARARPARCRMEGLPRPDRAPRLRRKTASTTVVAVALYSGSPALGIELDWTRAMPTDY